jgi:hypothetical protein
MGIEIVHSIEGNRLSNTIETAADKACVPPKREANHGAPRWVIVRRGRQARWASRWILEQGSPTGGSGVAIATLLHVNGRTNRSRARDIAPEGLRGRRRYHAILDADRVIVRRTASSALRDKSDVPRAAIRRASVSSRSKHLGSTANQDREQVPIHDEPPLASINVVICETEDGLGGGGLIQIKPSRQLVRVLWISFIAEQARIFAINTKRRVFVRDALKRVRELG